MSDGDVNNELENMVEFTFRLEKRLTPWLAVFPKNKYRVNLRHESMLTLLG